MPITLPGNRTLTLYALPGGGYSTVQPVDAGGVVTVSGSGFGAAPNVVLFRRFREGSDGGVISLTPPDGEIGTYTTSGLGVLKYYEMPDGYTAYAGYDPEHSVAAVLNCLFGENVTELRLSKTEIVPPGKYFPGASAENTIPTTSTLKHDWLRKTINSGGVGYENEPDLCIPTQTGNTGGLMKLQGNATHPRGTQSEGSYADFWSFADWNTFSFYQKPDVADPVGTPGEFFEFFITSDKINANKSTGTITKSYSVPAFANSGPGTVVNADAFYTLVRAYSYLTSQGGANTQMVRRNWYAAVGAGVSRQGIMLGNNSAFNDCTLSAWIIPDSWSDTLITFTPDAWESSVFTHYHIIKPDGSVVSGALS